MRRLNTNQTAGQLPKPAIIENHAGNRNPKIMANILVIDDDQMLCDMMCRHFEYMQHKSACGFTLKEGLDLLKSASFDVVFLDVRLPDGDGLTAIPKIRHMSYSPEVIIITGEGDPNGAELAIKNGAWDYIQKPLSPNKMDLPLTRALQYRENLESIKKAPVVLKRENIIGSSPKVMACLDSVARVAGTDVNVMLTGETGTGKELFAKTLHDNSGRTAKNFVVVDCAAIPETLIESSLFGYEKGAFTGADQFREGLIKQADGGTLFLDEVGELSLTLQKAFLRVLEERRYRPVGSKQEVKSDFRLISATNRDLDQMTKNGQFREDLLHRLRTTIIELPPLRENLEDLKAVAVHHMIDVSGRYGIETKGFSPDFFDVLCAYAWPGNVRELIHVLEDCINRARYEPTLFPQHLPSRIRIQVTRSAVAPTDKQPVDRASPDESFQPTTIPRYRDFRNTVLAGMEKKYFQKLIKSTRGDIQKACQLSGLGRSRLYTLLKKFNISRSGWNSK
jgi:two-component system NtrC family response regulator